MPQKQRAAAVARFQAGGSKAFVFTAGAGGVRESRRRGCYYADAPSPSRLKHLLKVEGGRSGVTGLWMARWGLP